jgi:WD40 repeat protein
MADYISKSSQYEILRKFDGELYSLEIFNSKLFTGGVDNSPLGNENGVIHVYNLQSHSWNSILTKSKGEIYSLLRWKNDHIFASIYNRDTYSYSISLFNSQGEHCASYPTTKDGFCLIEWRGYLVSAGRNKICIWDIQSKSIKSSWNVSSSVWSLCVWNEMLCSGHSNGTISLWNDESGNEMMNIRGHTNVVGCLAVQREHLISGSWDTTIRKWNIQGECVSILKGHEHYVVCLAISNNGRILFSGSNDNTIMIWNQSNECIQVFKDAGHVRGLKIFHGKLFSASFDGTLRCWSGEMMRKYLSFLVVISLLFLK